MFIDRLKTECEKRNIGITPFVIGLGLSAGNLSKWRSGTVPGGSALSQIADALEISTDYLLERTDDPSPMARDMRKLDDKEMQLIDGLRVTDATTRKIIFDMASVALSSTTTETQTIPLAPVFFASHDGNSYHANEKPRRPQSKKHVEGDAAAGPPITAVPETDLMITVPSKYLSDNYFIVRARGDSMIGTNIDDGDFCVFQKDAYHDEGRIMLVQIEGSTELPEGTIKRVYFHGKQIELRSANRAYEPMFFQADEVRITGVLVDILTPDE